MRFLVLFVMLELILSGSVQSDRRPALCKKPLGKPGQTLVKSCTDKFVCTLGKDNKKSKWQTCPIVASQDTLKAFEANMSADKADVDSKMSDMKASLKDLFKQHLEIIRLLQDIVGYASVWTEDAPPNFPCIIDVGENACSGTLQVKNENYTLIVDIDNSTLDNCQPMESGKEVTVYSNSKHCEKYEFILDVDASSNPNQIIMATVWPKDGTLPCPLIGFDIGCSSCSPGKVEPNKCLCDNDCFKGPSSWEECASQCLGVTGTDELPKRGNYVGWSFQSRASNQGFGGNCCCKNIKNGVFHGNSPSSTFGDAKCLGSGGNSP